MLDLAILCSETEQIAMSSRIIRPIKMSRLDTPFDSLYNPRTLTWHIWRLLLVVLLAVLMVFSLEEI